MQLQSRNMAAPATFAVALVVLHLSLAICVLGRPHPDPHITESSHSANELQLRSILHHFQHPALSRSAASTLERRVLRDGRRGGGPGGVIGGVVIDPVYTTTGVIVYVIIFVPVAIITLSILAWCGYKKRKNPSWSFLDYFRRRKQPAADKLSADTDMGVTTPSEAAETHKSSVDASRLGNTESGK